MTDKQEGGKIEAGRVFIFEKDIKNETYSGKDSVESHQYWNKVNVLYEKWWIKYLLLPLIVVIAASNIIFKFGWR